MAVLTTLNGALGPNDYFGYFASLAGIAAGDLGTIDREVVKVLSVPTSTTMPVPLQRGIESAQVAHPSGAQVKFGKTPTALSVGDFPQPVPGASQLVTYPANPAREFMSYSAAGAITLPRIGNDMVAVLNGVVALAMTIANPSVLADGSRLIVVGNGKAAHTVTYAAGLGNVGGTADVITFAAAQAQGIELMACGGFWVALGMNTAVAGAGATINGVGLG